MGDGRAAADTFAAYFPSSSCLTAWLTHHSLPYATPPLPPFPVSLLQRLGGYLEFFLQTVPVAPNRFRPANHVGDSVYEHPQVSQELAVYRSPVPSLSPSSRGEGRNEPSSGSRSSSSTRSRRSWI